MPKTDRRVRKTKAQLTQGLITLMKLKDIKDISVKELTDLVDINRGTFYLHYSDIYDMVYQIEDEEFNKFTDILDKDLSANMGTASYYDALLDIFRFLDANKELTRVLISPHGDLSFVNRLKDLVNNRLASLMSKPDDDADFEICFAFIVSGFIGIFENWLLSESPQSPEYMAELGTTLISQGMFLCHK